MKGIKAPNIGLKENNSPRKNRVYVLPDGSVQNSSMEIKGNPYNTMMYPHAYGYPGHMGQYAHGGYGGYGHGYGHGAHQYGGYGGHGYAGHGAHHPYGGGYGGHGYAHGGAN